MLEVYTDCSLTKNGATVSCIAISADEYIGSTILALPNIKTSFDGELLGVQKSVDLISEYVHNSESITIYCDNLNVVKSLQTGKSPAKCQAFKRLYSYLKHHNNVTLQHTKGHAVSFPNVTPQFAVDRIATFANHISRKENL